MIGNWFRRKIWRASVKSAREDLESFVLSLRGASDQELGMVVAMATTIRLQLSQSGSLPEYALALPTPDDDASMIQFHLGRLVRQLQKMDKTAEAVGAMVWLHSMRALAFPEIRSLGRQMWKELQRGIPHAPDALDGLGTVIGKTLPEGARSSCDFIPIDLAPEGHQSAAEASALDEDDNPIAEVETPLRRMGYDLTLLGAGVALAGRMSGYNSVETASHIALITLALDIKEAGFDIEKLAAFIPRAEAHLKVLKEYKDRGMMDPALWKNDATAVFGVTMVDEHQEEWIEKVLSDEMAGKGRLAKSRLLAADEDQNPAAPGD